MTHWLKRLIAGFFVFLLLHGVAAAAEEFEVTDIQVRGLQRISAGTIFNYLPIKVGDIVDDATVNEAIKALFDTGFFKDIEFERDGGVLVVIIAERPSVSSIEINGNKEFDTDILKKAMLQIGFGEGLVYKQAILDKVTQEIRSQYYSRGKYSVDIETTVTPQQRNRVKINIDIDEGKTAKIGKVNFVGNEAFTDKQLLAEVQLKPKTGFKRLYFLSKQDQYSKEKLSGDLETLRSFYQDQGYLDFRITSTQVSISSNKKEIFITVYVDEGDIYTVDEIKLRGKFVVPEKDLVDLVNIRSGDVFSRKEVEATSKAISDRLAAEGYTFANVNPVPDIDKENRKVSFTFFIDPAKRVYVRRISIAGNVVTRDEVIRREMRQMEGGWLSTAKIQRSRVRLQRLSYFDDVNIETPAVAGTDDQVDVKVTVKERQTGNLSFGLGYSGSDGMLVQASVSQKNLFGSGKELDFSIDNSRVTKTARLRYFNPYHTPNGVSRGFYLSYTDIDAGRAGLVDYINETLSLGVNYRFPLSEHNAFGFSFGPDRVKLSSTSETPPEIDAYIQVHPDDWLLKTTANWTHDTRDSILYPTRGFYAILSGEVSLPSSDVEYYKAGVRGDVYVPTFYDLVFRLGGDFGYGEPYGDTKLFPFYKNYYAGGPTSVRGYKSRSLGPKDSGLTPRPLGGTRKLSGTAEILIPFFGSETKDKRFSLFVDGGMVFGPDEDVALNELRYAWGVGLNWYSPVGPLQLSYALPINNKAEDDTERFQFTMGRAFR
jgi:outer membrane protein insertion porin family